MKEQKATFAIWKQVNIYGDESLHQTYDVLKNQKKVAFSERANKYFLFTAPIIPSAPSAHVLNLVKRSIHDLGFTDRAAAPEIASHAYKQGYLCFSPKAVLQIIQKYLVPDNDTKFVLLTKVHEKTDAVIVTFSRDEKMCIDVREAGKSFPTTNSPYAFLLIAL